MWAKVADSILDMVRDSIIIQSLITLTVVVTISIMTYQGREVPKEMWMLAGSVMGYWFGAKADYNVTKRLEKYQASLVMPREG